jgi:branched-chain amino acid transport system substrate-binding protein
MKGLSGRLVGTLVMTLAICTFGLASGSKEGAISIGAVIPLTGELAKFGEMQRNSYRLAIDEINKAGGVNGRPIELFIEDDTGKPEVGRSAAEKLMTQDKIVLLTGGYSSSVTMGLAQLAQHRKTPYISHTGAADEITEKGWEWVFRINQPASEYFKGLVSFLQEVAKPNTVVVIHESSLFGQSQGKSFVATCEKIGIKVLMREGFESGALDFKPLITKIKAAKPEMVYAIAYVMDAPLLIRQSRELDFNPKLFAGGGGGFSLPEFWTNAGDAGDYVFSATLWHEDLPFPGAREYFENYLKKFNEPPQFVAAQAYVALYVIADILKRAKDLTPEAIREAALGTDLNTMYGPVKFISYGKKTQQNFLPTYVGQWQKGRFELVWPRELASKPFVFPVPEWRKR